MSLPTYIGFYKGEKFLDRVFINVGWFINFDALVREFYDKYGEFPKDYDFVIVYNNKFTKDEIEEMLNAYKIYKIDAYKIYERKEF